MTHTNDDEKRRLEEEQGQADSVQIEHPDPQSQKRGVTQVEVVAAAAGYAVYDFAKWLFGRRRRGYDEQIELAQRMSDRSVVPEPASITGVPVEASPVESDFQAAQPAIATASTSDTLDIDEKITTSTSWDKDLAQHRLSGDAGATLGGVSGIAGDASPTGVPTVSSKKPQELTTSTTSDTNFVTASSGVSGSETSDRAESFFDLTGPEIRYGFYEEEGYRAEEDEPQIDISSTQVGKAGVTREHSLQGLGEEEQGDVEVTLPNERLTESRTRGQAGDVLGTAGAGLAGAGVLGADALLNLGKGLKPGPGEDTPGDKTKVQTGGADSEATNASLWEASGSGEIDDTATTQPSASPTLGRVPNTVDASMMVDTPSVKVTPPSAEMHWQLDQQGSEPGSTIPLTEGETREQAPDILGAASAGLAGAGAAGTDAIRTLGDKPGKRADGTMDEEGISATLETRSESSPQAVQTGSVDAEVTSTPTIDEVTGTDRTVRDESADKGQEEKSKGRLFGAAAAGLAGVGAFGAKTLSGLDEGLKLPTPTIQEESMAAAGNTSSSDDVQMGQVPPVRIETDTASQVPTSFDASTEKITAANAKLDAKQTTPSSTEADLKTGEEDNEPTVEMPSIGRQASERASGVIGVAGAGIAGAGATSADAIRNLQDNLGRRTNDGSTAESESVTLDDKASSTPRAAQTGLGDTGDIGISTPEAGPTADLSSEGVEKSQQQKGKGTGLILGTAAAGLAGAGALGAEALQDLGKGLKRPTLSATGQNVIEPAGEQANVGADSSVTAEAGSQADVGVGGTGSMAVEGQVHAPTIAASLPSPSLPSKLDEDERLVAGLPPINADVPIQTASSTGAAEIGLPDANASLISDAGQRREAGIAPESDSITGDSPTDTGRSGVVGGVLGTTAAGLAGAGAFGVSALRGLTPEQKGSGGVTPTIDSGATSEAGPGTAAASTNDDRRQEAGPPPDTGSQGGTPDIDGREAAPGLTTADAGGQGAAGAASSGLEKAGLGAAADLGAAGLGLAGAYGAGGTGQGSRNEQETGDAAKAAAIGAADSGAGSGDERTAGIGEAAVGVGTASAAAGAAGSAIGGAGAGTDGSGEPRAGGAGTAGGGSDSAGATAASPIGAGSTGSNGAGMRETAFGLLGAMFLGVMMLFGATQGSLFQGINSFLQGPKSSIVQTVPPGQNSAGAPVSTPQGSTTSGLLGPGVVGAIGAAGAAGASGPATGSGNATNTQPTPTTASPTPTPTVGILPVEGPFTVLFSAGKEAVQTQRDYSGPVTIAVSGFGQAADAHYSDAFYVYTNTQGQSVTPYHDPKHSLCINGQSVDKFVPNTPAYNPSHAYTITFNAPGGPLSFGVCDDRYNDNTGSFTIAFK